MVRREASIVRAARSAERRSRVACCICVGVYAVVVLIVVYVCICLLLLLILSLEDFDSFLKFVQVQIVQKFV